MEIVPNRHRLHPSAMCRCRRRLPHPLPNQARRSGSRARHRGRINPVSISQELYVVWLEWLLRPGPQIGNREHQYFGRLPMIVAISTVVVQVQARYRRHVLIWKEEAAAESIWGYGALHDVHAP
jgi:hypothetical protein